MGVTKRDIRNVTIAGLIHDLGHGPFSHSFEKWMAGKKYAWPLFSALSFILIIGRLEIPFHHEDMSKRMFRYLVDDNCLDMEEDDVKFIEELVGGNYSRCVFGGDLVFVWMVTCVTSILLTCAEAKMRTRPSCLR